MVFLLPHLPVGTLPRFLGLLPPTATLLLIAILPFPGPGLLGPDVIPEWCPDPVPYRLLPVARYTGDCFRNIHFEQWDYLWVLVEVSIYLFVG